MSVALRNQNPAIALLPGPNEWTMIKEQATVLVRSGFLPTQINTPEKAMAIALKGREIGLPMMLAFTHIAIINGKPCMSAELMMAQIFRLVPDAKIDFKEVTNEVCKVVASRRNSAAKEFSFSMDDAKRAELSGKGNWNKFPRAMLRSRCISEMARSMFPDALAGMSYTPEELNPDIVLSEDGDVIEHSPAPAQRHIAPPQAIEHEHVIDAVEAHSGPTNGHSDAGEYVATFGTKFKGKRLADCSESELVNYCNFLRDSASKQKKKLNGPALEFVEAVDRYLQPKPNPQIEQELTGDIPF